jgi:hypothetical protein
MKYNARGLAHRLLRGDSVFNLPQRKTNAGRKAAARVRVRALIRGVALSAAADPSEEGKRRMAFRRLRGMREFGKSFKLPKLPQQPQRRRQRKHNQRLPHHTIDQHSDQSRSSTFATDDADHVSERFGEAIERFGPGKRGGNASMSQQDATLHGNGSDRHNKGSSKGMKGRSKSRKRNQQDGDARRKLPVGEWLRAGGEPSSRREDEDSTELAEASPQPPGRVLQRTQRARGSGRLLTAAANGAADGIMSLLRSMRIARAFSKSKERVRSMRGSSRTLVGDEVTTFDLGGIDEEHGEEPYQESSQARPQATGTAPRSTPRKPEPASTTVGRAPKASKMTASAALRQQEAQAKVRAAKEAKSGFKAVVHPADKARPRATLSAAAAVAKVSGTHTSPMRTVNTCTNMESSGTEDPELELMDINEA